MSAARQQETLERWLTRRDDRSLAEACEAWDRYAQYYAHRYARQLPAEHDDCIQVARVGLIKALRRFDVSRGNQFTTYATWVIMGEFTQYQRNCLTTICIPEWLRALRAKVLAIPDDDPARIAARLGVPVEKVELVLRIQRLACPMSLTTATRHDGMTERDEEWDFGAVDPVIEEIDNGGADQASAILERLMPLLPERQQKALWLRIGFGLPLRETGQHLGVSYETASKDEKKGLARLRVTVERMGQEAFA